jgi:hypothetical protein
MSKRTANRNGPTKNKGPKNYGRNALHRELKAARRAEDVTWFGSIVDKLRSM